jgi:hypothetical protein
MASNEDETKQGSQLCQGKKRLELVVVKIQRSNLKIGLDGWVFKNNKIKQETFSSLELKERLRKLALFTQHLSLHSDL